jgi:hypothetical protein
MKYMNLPSEIQEALKANLPTMLDALASLKHKASQNKSETDYSTFEIEEVEIKLKDIKLSHNTKFETAAPPTLLSVITTSPTEKHGNNGNEKEATN